MSEQKFYGAWSILFGSVFGSFFGAGYMLYQNYKSLGKQKSGLVVLLVYVFLMIGVAVLSVLEVSAEGGYWFTAVLIAFIHYSSAQRSLIKNSNNLEHFPFWNVTLVCFASLLLLLVLFFFLVPQSNDNTPRVTRDSVIKEFTIGAQEDIYQKYYDENGEYPTRENVSLESVDVTGGGESSINLNFGQVDNSSDRSRFCIFHFLENKENGSLYAANQSGHGYINEVPENLDDCDGLIE